MSSGLGQWVPPPTGTRLVIPDLHGCSLSLRALLEQIEPSKEDQIFFLGDYVSKGPDNVGVLACITELISNGYHIYPLLGNHDQLLIDYLDTGSKILETKLVELNDGDFLSRQLSSLRDYMPLLKRLVPFFESGDFFLVHAGFDFRQPDPFSDLNSMLTIRNFNYDPAGAKGKTIVHGHYPQPLEVIRETIAHDSKIIPLDNGCVYQNRPDQGRLLCLNLDTFRLWVQPNIDLQ